jgi:integrase
MLQNSKDAILDDFRQFCKETLGHKDIHTYSRYIRDFLEGYKGNLLNIREFDVRTFKANYSNFAPNTIANVVKSIRAFIKYLKTKTDDPQQKYLLDEAVRYLKTPQIPVVPADVPDKSELKRFNEVLVTDREKAMFLVFATSGLRKHELLSLTADDIDTETRIIRPKTRSSQTKHVWITLYGEEANEPLIRYIKSKNSWNGSKLFNDSLVRRTFDRVNSITGLHLTPQRLRESFCQMLKDAKVDRDYIDAFCGRIGSMSVQGKHYTDLTAENLKRIYDGANIRVLS